ncbi:hypothetical protein EJ05DRAFT_486663 [Pseudovirgaria hyperparasitica]|uniref:Uncharacterized protein n=1 Tax=Pseudovirgaria hyperparasitica TaxID=470096 RepID=A0A6A6W6P2_9PEZI|nr:uncharacterized protein EJ05DRAFT_486663 [Pseudovirgaria hyperparasitica]KAF2757630.1 hypothetical protein EJ05DRAFT_486663 [Pseudovirgaria hyperparasitica]
MNWTGGRLQRHSKNSTNTVVSRQKQHFARVRAQLQSTASPTVPFIPSFAQAEQDRLVGRKAYQGRPHRRDKPDLDAIHERPTERTPLSTEWYLGRNLDHYRSQTEVPKPKLLRERAVSKEKTLHVERPFKQQGQLYDPHARLTDQNPPDRNAQDMHAADDGNFDDERRRLLQQDDWVGIAPSRPLQMHFRSRREKSRVGKRRKVAVNMRARHGLSCEEMIHFSVPQFQYAPGSIDDEDISIRIGPDALPWQSPEVERCRRTTSPRSDLMLLDAEPTTENHQIRSMVSPCIADRTSNFYRESDISQQNAKVAFSPVPVSTPGLGCRILGEQGDDVSNRAAETWNAGRKCDRGVLQPPRMKLNSSITHGPGVRDVLDSVGHGPQLHLHGPVRAYFPSSSARPLKNASPSVSRVDSNVDWRDFLALPSQHSASPRRSRQRSEDSSPTSSLPCSAKPLESISTSLFVDSWCERTHRNQIYPDMGKSPTPPKATAAMPSCPRRKSEGLDSPRLHLAVAGAATGDEVWRKFVFSDRSFTDSAEGTDVEDHSVVATDGATVVKAARSIISHSLSPSASERMIVTSEEDSDMSPVSLGCFHGDMHARHAQQYDLVSTSAMRTSKKRMYVIASDSMYNHASQDDAPYALESRRYEKASLPEDDTPNSKSARAPTWSASTILPRQNLSSFSSSLEKNLGVL